MQPWLHTRSASSWISHSFGIYSETRQENSKPIFSYRVESVAGRIPNAICRLASTEGPLCVFRIAFGRCIGEIRAILPLKIALDRMGEKLRVRHFKMISDSRSARIGGQAFLQM